MIPRVRKQSVLLSLVVLVFLVIITHYLILISVKSWSSLGVQVKSYLHAYKIFKQNDAQVGSHAHENVVHTDISSTTVQNTPPFTNQTTPTTNVTSQANVAPPHFITCGEYGQLGNAMFQYAGLLGVAKNNAMVPVVRPQYQLTSIFQLTHLKDLGAKHNWTVVFESAYGTYDARLERLPPADILLSAYLQSYKYFHNNSEEVRREFTFQDHIKKEAEAFMTSLQPVIKGRVPVGVHVRRGDKLLYKDQSQGDMVASATYFEKAFQDMRTRHGDVVFLVATDDASWCESTFRNKSEVIILNFAPREVHLCFLSMCRHVIMSVGTFGWWGGWLAGGDVIYYKHQVRDGSPRASLFNISDFALPQWRGIGD